MASNTATNKPSRKGIDFDDRYTIHCPFLKTTKEWPNGLVPVDSKSRQQLTAFLDRFGKYISRENHYDFPLGTPRDEKLWKAYLFLGNYYSLSTQQPIGAVVFTFHDDYGGLSPRWVLEWVWIHPYFRREGLLSKHWPAFCKEFGNFLPHGPFSKGMREFLIKQGKCIQCWKPCADFSYLLLCDDCHKEFTSEREVQP